ncbi:4-hydroxybenzoate polyprenyltransferase [Paraoerskovia marina]|uniref:4-hydroxybenzoate polyprenyltransferase n=1 Tax=Paraoerskovia marina TaxID=545619 RepID=A0A1H1MIN9_9CELL|nr:UbiA family prenyltransferase [Paraoerskovia marina]SDR86714.1 4-hydroxybenzoate polyprenyltransferase [Paraoerskovia marina]
MRWADVAELVRLPAALTVPGDTLAGAAAAGWPCGARTAALPVSSIALYWAGMALNDWADRDLDATERPERPVPSGRVTPGQALATAGVLTGVGLGAAAVAGPRALGVAACLAAAVWTYDVVAKPTPAGPVVMASTRALDVLLGAAGSPRALPAAGVVGAHTLAVTALARGEVHGTTPTVAGAAVATTAAVAAGAGALAVRGRRGPTAVVAGAALAVVYAVSVLPAQREAYESPDAQRARRATGAGIRAMVPLQASLVAGRGAVVAAACLLGAVPLARRAARAVSFT